MIKKKNKIHTGSYRCKIELHRESSMRWRARLLHFFSCSKFFNCLDFGRMANDIIGPLNRDGMNSMGPLRQTLLNDLNYF